MTRATRTALTSILAASLLTGAALAQTFELLSRGVGGTLANGDAERVRVTPDGRFVAYESRATNLVASDTNGSGRDVFVLDRQTGVIELVSRKTNSEQSPAPTFLGDISADGRWVTMLGDGLENVAGDPSQDVYLRDRLNGTTIEVTPNGQSSASYGWPLLTANASHVVLQYTESCTSYLKLYNRLTGQVSTLRSLQSCYNAGSTVSGVVRSPDGTKLLFGEYGWLPPGNPTSASLNLLQLPGITETAVHYQLGPQQEFYARAISNDGLIAVAWFEEDLAQKKAFELFDRGTGERRTIFSASSSASMVYLCEISADGRLVFFVTSHANLVPGDLPGTSDLFSYDVRTRLIQRINLGLVGQPSTPAVRGFALDSDLASVFLSSGEPGWVSGDINGKVDVFRRSLCYSHVPDLDLDGFGAPGVPQLLCLPSPPGWSRADTDCDDTNPARHPGAAELCNGLDDDCDGSVDSPQFDWFVDADGDGFGSPAGFVFSCTQPPGHVANALDCDDTRDYIHPNADERCNGLDDDCDGAVDNGTLFLWYFDADGDGFGSSPLAQTCQPAPGYVGNAFDCNDANPSRFLGAPELCNGIDDDCDQLIDDGLLFDWYLDLDGDGYGDPATKLVTCNPPPGYVAPMTDCNDADAAVNPGAFETCNGVDDDCDGQVDERVNGATFCAGSPSSTGCLPKLTASGCLSAAGSSSLVLTLSEMPGARFGAVLYGLATTNAIPGTGHPSTICIASPLQRTTALSSSGTLGQCNGQIALDFTAWAAANPTGLGLPVAAGQTLYFQGWIRDSGYLPAIVLTAGWMTTVLP